MRSKIEITGAENEIFPAGALETTSCDKGSSNDDNVPDPLKQAREASPHENNSSPIPKWRKVLGFVWDTAEGDEEYRRYVQRLDLIFLYDIPNYLKLAFFYDSPLILALQPNSMSRLLHKISRSDELQ
jgi:hypothetical protein